MSDLMDNENKGFITALIDEAINNLTELKDAIIEEDHAKLTKCTVTLGNLRMAATKWMKED